jgi:ribosomal protein S18 acetylase RimI-like enzyme
VFRLHAGADPAFLTEMLYEAVYWRDDGAEERPPLDELLVETVPARYVTGWGRAHDVAITALERNDEPVGAAWYRRFTVAEPGYGFVAPDVPEISIAVYPEFRGRHLGELLLGALSARAAAAGERALSLSVARENPARRLYLRAGFEVVSEDGDSSTMLLELT